MIKILRRKIGKGRNDIKEREDKGIDLKDDLIDLREFNKRRE